MKGYGQFCPLALACEFVGERWTPLVLRELLLGAHRFNDIHRGVPRMSPSLLSRRLRRLEHAGVVRRQHQHGRVVYELTEAGSELVPVIQSLATWGKRWLPATLGEGHADPDLVMWDMHRRIDLGRLPAGRTVVQFDVTDQPPARRTRWLVCQPQAVELCIVDPGWDVDLYVVTDSETLNWVWYGDLGLGQAITDARITLHGPRALCRAFPSWLQLSVLAPVARLR